MNGNEAHSLDEWWQFGSAASLEFASDVKRDGGVKPLANRQMILSTKWMICFKDWGITVLGEKNGNKTSISAFPLIETYN